jgi:hypothetical protein
MARKARIKNEFGIFHIVQHGGNCRTLFQNDLDREKFLSILERSKKKFNFVLHGYCLLDPNTYDLIIDVNGGDLSKIMKSINIAYAMYVKCDGKLFLDRYKSTLLDNEVQLYESKSNIKNKKLSLETNNKYNMCYENIQPIEIASLDLDDCDNCIKCINTANKKLELILNNKGISISDLNTDKELRNQLIKSFRKSSTLSLKSLGQLFGGLSESSVSKILNT